MCFLAKRGEGKHVKYHKYCITHEQYVPCMLIAFDKYAFKFSIHLSQIMAKNEFPLDILFEEVKSVG